MNKKNRTDRKRQEQLKRDWKLYHRKYIHKVSKQEQRNNPTFHEFRRLRLSNSQPSLSEIVEFWASRKDHIGYKSRIILDDGHIKIPPVFSLTQGEYQTESFRLICRLFDLLYNERVQEVRIDYSVCLQIDVDASVCMDVLLQQFIIYYRDCDRFRIGRHVKSIGPIHYEKDSIRKVLFSIGGFSLLKGVVIDFPDIIPLRLQTGTRKDNNNIEKRAREITNIVDYVEKCLGRMNHTLSDDASRQLYDVIGEVMINADEHATTDYRYSIGYFQECQPNEKALGILQLAIMNFGDTIYEKFKDPTCPNQNVVKQMEELSAEYTKGGWFRKAAFEEETLWTLYAIQQGVTSKLKKRGNGFISLIDRFFGLKGDTRHDDMSQMTIISGHTRIIFDGTHQIQTLEVSDKYGRVRDRKIMSFNETGSLQQQPDNNFVKFVAEYFPGTLISAKICIKPGNTEPLTL